ncbi:LuxR C-terminal-related transcriptional regulator [Nonomuraea solani]|uniref:LuxR C-terminal-related transcriptional regulator n=1 Tax=Nonomuraea solani TaxID=1144553 RepID=UPI000CDF131E|nr:LuxR C-terminal-related transcriptional regulator [Nonomuraea solani]
MDLTKISTREADVLAAVGLHLSNAQIASRLHISVRTVESHVAALLRKLDASDRQALAALAEQAQTGRFAGLPVSRTTFVGRAAEVAAVESALDKSRLVTVVGPGGVGKTRLAAAVAERAESRFPAGGAFVDLVPVRTAAVAGSVVQAVADALDVTVGPTQSVERAVFERLRPGRPLLVLDNCEHVIDEVSVLTEQVLAACPQATVLATSRQRLGVTGERLVHVRPLAGTEVEQLFRDRAGAADPGFAAPPTVVADVCARLDGLPLAVELAAARVAALGADGLLTGLDDQLRLLAGGRGAHVRHHSLRELIGWSYDLLDADERTLFRRLSAFVGVFDLNAVAALSPQATPAEVADLLGRLVDQNLVVRTGPGWRLLDSIRAFGLSQASVVGEQDAIRERYLLWAFATAADVESRLDADWRSAFDGVADDLRAAAIAVGSDPAAHGFLRTLAHLTFAAGRFVEARTLYQAAARCATGIERGQDLRAGAYAALTVADNRTATELMRQAVEAAGTADLRAEAVMVGVRYNFGPIESATDDQARLLAEARKTADANPSDQRLAALVAMATAWHEGHGWMPDLGWAREAVELARAAGDPLVLLAAMDALCNALDRAGAAREAHRLAGERLRIAITLPRHDPAAAAEIVDAFHVAPRAALGAGDLPAALALARQAHGDDPIGEHPYLQAPRLVRVLALTGDFDEAISRAETLWAAWRRDGNPSMPWMNSALALAGMIQGLRGDPTGRRRWRERSLTVAAGSPVVAACRAFADVRVTVHCGRYDDAAGQVERAFAPFSDQRWVGYARVVGAELAVMAGLPDAGDRIIAAEPYAAESDWAAACLARVRGRLGDHAALADAAERWYRLGARFERAATLALLPDRADEGHTELAALGCR